MLGHDASFVNPGRPTLKCGLLFLKYAVFSPCRSRRFRVLPKWLAPRKQNFSLFALDMEKDRRLLQHGGPDGLPWVLRGPFGFPHPANVRRFYWLTGSEPESVVAVAAHS